ncbi:MAG: hypothetical protein V4508_06290 [Pseudomonadota bacterium]
MKPSTLALSLCALLLGANLHAATPPGHPGAVAQADLPYVGKVISTIDASQYTYIEVLQDKKVLWLAAPAIALKKNNIIRFEDGAEMSNFHSKTLNRTFPAIRFINRVVLSNDKN